MAARQIRGFGGKVGIEVYSSIADTAFDKRAKAAVDQPGAVEFGGLRNAIELTDQPPALPVLSTSARKT
ncbi:hypothetical protein D5047_20995 [Verminephrobacter eiseniae]|nr:hypothetical protein [Verminephrobacter eiseniae]